MAAEAGQKFCTTCGKQIHERAEICPYCGVRQPGMTPVGGKNKMTAALLAIFLGGLGIHKFYLGQGVMGVIYLLFSWTLIPVIIGFIEGIVYLSMNDETFNLKYNH